MISRILDYVHERTKEGVFKNIDPRTIVYAYQAMISNLVLYKNILNEMDFVSIKELSRDGARIFLGGIMVHPFNMSGADSKKRGVSYGG